jgi:glycerate 2-kinase
MQIELEKFFDVAIDAVRPKNIISKIVTLKNNELAIGNTFLDLGTFNYCYLCGSGKAAAQMAVEMEKILGSQWGGGVIVSPERPTFLQQATCIEATHPFPSAKSIAAADAMIGCFESTGEKDLIVYLLSGGTSSLMEKPIPPIALDDFIGTTQLLLENGFSIEELNAVRKHLSLIKGGRLAEKTNARIIVLVISDVIGDDLSTIGSAPLHSDASSYSDVATLLKERNLFSRLAPSVQKVLNRGVEGKIDETPKTVRSNVTHQLLSSNIQALNAAAEYARELGIPVKLDSKPISGDVESAAKSFVEVFKTLPAGTLLLRGGETTVTVTGNGRGGRNQHFALLSLQALKECCPYTIIAAGTDGIDGNSDAAGAIISDALYRDSRDKEINLQQFIHNFDSHTLFEQLGAAIKTGYTGTNVMDVIIAYKGDS